MSDRLGGLPDDVISHILSFLPLKSSAQTSLLSKTWRFLWAHVQFLEFRSKDYRNSQTPARKILNHIVQSQQHHHHHIHTVRLDYRAHDSTDQDLDSWIAHFASRKIRTLSVRLVDHLALPPRLFACSTLVELSLRDCGEIPIRGVSLPALKKLQLNGVDCVDYEESRESLPVLLSGCPALEELSVEGVMCLVTSPTIASLVIDPNYDTWTYAERAAAAVRLVTPALRCLLLRCDMNDDFSAGPLESLLVAYIDLYCREPLRENSVYSRQVLAFVGKLFNVQRLSLSTKPMAIPDSDFSAFTVEFRNLTELYLRADIRFIMTFLENANNLRVLKLKFRNVVDMDDRYCWMEPKQVPACLISHLKSVSIFGFGCSKEHEFEVIGYVLMNAQVLKRMKIYNRYRLDWKMKFGALKRFLLFKRGSEACELDFYLDGSGIRLSKLSRKIVNLLKSENEY